MPRKLSEKDKKELGKKGRSVLAKKRGKAKRVRRRRGWDGSAALRAYRSMGKSRVKGVSRKEKIDIGRALRKSRIATGRNPNTGKRVTTGTTKKRTTTKVASTKRAKPKVKKFRGALRAWNAISKNSRAAYRRVYGGKMTRKQKASTGRRVRAKKQGVTKPKSSGKPKGSGTGGAFGRKADPAKHGAWRAVKQKMRGGGSPGGYRVPR